MDDFDVEQQTTGDDAEADGLLGALELVNELPAFADADNVALNARVLALEEQIRRSKLETSEHLERHAAMSEHVRAVQLEMSHAEALLEAKKREAKTEEHLLHLVDRALGRVQTDEAAIAKREAAVCVQLQTAAQDIARATSRIAELKEQATAQTGTIARWEAAMRRADDDAAAVARYAKEDEVKASALQRELEKITATLAGRRAELEELTTDASSSRNELDKVAADYAALHAERSDILARWQGAVKTAERREGEAAGARERAASIARAVAAKRAVLVQQRATADKLRARRGEAERALVHVEARAADARSSASRAGERVGSARDRLEGLACEVEGARGDKARLAEDVGRLEGEARAKEAAVEAARRRVEASQARLADTLAAAQTAGGSLRAREALLASQSATVAKLEREAERLNGVHVTARQAVAEVGAQAEGLRLQIAGATRRARNMRDKARELASQAGGQMEHVYAAEFAIQDAERRLSRVRGEVSDEEKVALTARKRELGALLEAAGTAEKAVAAQVKDLRAALQGALRRQGQLASDVASASAAVEEASLQSSSCEEALRAASRDRAEALVAHDSLKLELRRMRDALSARADAVFGAENRAVQLALSIEARKVAVETDARLARARVRLLERERHSLAMDLADRSARVRVLQARYDALRGRIRGSGGGGEGVGADGELVSQASIVVQAARRREALHQAAAAVGREVDAAEAEVCALRATLTHVASRNTALREALRAADPDSPEAGMVRSLQVRIAAASGDAYARKRELGRLQARIDADCEDAERDERAAAGLVLHGEQLRREIQRDSAALQEASAALTALQAQVGVARAALRAKRAASAGPATTTAGRPQQRPSSGRPASAGLAAADADGLTVEEASCLAQALNDASGGVVGVMRALAAAQPHIAHVITDAMTAHGVSGLSGASARATASGAGGSGKAGAGRLPLSSQDPAGVVALLTPQLPGGPVHRSGGASSGAAADLQVTSSSELSTRPASQRSSGTAATLERGSPKQPPAPAQQSVSRSGSISSLQQSGRSAGDLRTAASVADPGAVSPFGSGSTLRKEAATPLPRGASGSRAGSATKGGKHTATPTQPQLNLEGLSITGSPASRK